ncbi:Required for respiratory growth protein 9 mitochondrial [Ceratobasidium sp. UAMH 11750]|nr:Required for respiratory growth protein 9 mitochondrial [Ceratobasidium sp. UAMH 11750]
MEALREMHARDPIQFRTPVLASKFKISPEAVSRILKSKWRPSPERKAKIIARDNKAKDMVIAERMRIERAEAQRLFEGRLLLPASRRSGTS